MRRKMRGNEGRVREEDELYRRNGKKVAIGRI